MKAIVTVTGIDHTGIVAAVAQALAELDTNILNMSPVSYTHLTLPTSDLV